MEAMYKSVYLQSYQWCKRTKQVTHWFLNHEVIHTYEPCLPYISLTNAAPWPCLTSKGAQTWSFYVIFISNSITIISLSPFSHPLRFSSGINLMGSLCPFAFFWTSFPEHVSNNCNCRLFICHPQCTELHGGRDYILFMYFQFLSCEVSGIQWFMNIYQANEWVNEWISIWINFNKLLQLCENVLTGLPFRRGFHFISLNPHFGTAFILTL